MAHFIVWHCQYTPTIWFITMCDCATCPLLHANSYELLGYERQENVAQASDIKCKAMPLRSQHVNLHSSASQCSTQLSQAMQLCALLQPATCFSVTFCHCVVLMLQPAWLPVLPQAPTDAQSRAHDKEQPDPCACLLPWEKKCQLPLPEASAAMASASWCSCTSGATRGPPCGCPPEPPVPSMYRSCMSDHMSDSEPCMVGSTQAVGISMLQAGSRHAGSAKHRTAVV